jgi:hypothetical protein
VSAFVKTFRGRPVKRVKKTGGNVLLIYMSGPGEPGQQEVVSESEYNRGVLNAFVAATSGDLQWDDSSMVSTMPAAI